MVAVVVVVVVVVVVCIFEGFCGVSCFLFIPVFPVFLISRPNKMSLKFFSIIKKVRCLITSINQIVQSAISLLLKA